MSIKNKSYYKYAENVLKGKIVAGELVKLACNRFMRDLEREDLEFRADEYDKFLRFSRLFKHFRGKSAGKQFILEPWQEFFCANLIGFYWKGTNDRRFTSSVLCISRKQGKTALAALIAMWFLVGDGEASPEIDLAANSLAQAGVCWEFCEQFALQLDPREKAMKLYRKGIKSKFNVGSLNVFAADSTKLDGWNSSFFILDEYAAAKDSKMYDVLRSSQGQRQNPHAMVISTTGFFLEGPFKQMYDVGVEILHGTKEDDSQLLMLFSLDEGDDWTDEKNWEKIAPNLGVTVDKKYLREQVQTAKNNPAAEVGIKTKNFNCWERSMEVWIPDSYLLKCFDDFKLEDFKDRDVYCYVGVDLSAVSDLTAVSFLIVDEDENKYCYTDFFLPESALKESSNKEFYKYLHRTKQLHITQGNVVDYDYVLKRMLEVNNIIPCRKVYYDQWNATQFCVNATEEGLPLEPYSQSLGSFNKPTKEMNRLVRKGGITFNKSELQVFCFRNVTIKEDWNMNQKPIKINPNSNQKIDGVISSLMALAAYLSEPRYSNEITII